MVKIKEIFDKTRCASFFLEYLNKKHNFDYYLSNAEPEGQKSDIDFYGISKKDNSRIKLQLKTCDKEPIKNLVKDLNIELHNYNHTDWLSDIIKESEKKYSPQQKRELILLIHPHHFPPFKWGINIEKLRMIYSKSYFEGIYYICPPIKTIPQEKFLKEGFCLVIKDVFQKRNASSFDCGVKNSAQEIRW